jgi:hypothetical protein
MHHLRKAYALLDSRIIAVSARLYTPLSRLALFVVFFWFGALKLFDASPANELVRALLQEKLPQVSFEHFIIFLGNI